MSRQMESSYFDPAGLGLIALLWQWRRFLVINLLVVMVLAAGVTLLMPNWYRATATILPPRDESPMLSRGAMDLLVGLGPIGFAGAGLTATGSQQLVAVLRSRSLADVVIEKEGLVEHYGFEVSEAYARGEAMGIGETPFAKFLGRDLKMTDED